MSYELVVMTDNGSIIGTFDNPQEANDLYKFAKTMGYAIVTRKVDMYGNYIEKRFVNDETAYQSGLRPSIDGLKEIIERMEMEDIGRANWYGEKISQCKTKKQLEEITEEFRNDNRLTEEEKELLEIDSYAIYDYFEAKDYLEV